jgi:hypothetical protein
MELGVSNIKVYPTHQIEADSSARLPSYPMRIGAVTFKNHFVSERFNSNKADFGKSRKSREVRGRVLERFLNAVVRLNNRASDEM